MSSRSTPAFPSFRARLAICLAVFSCIGCFDPDYQYDLSRIDSLSDSLAEAGQIDSADSLLATVTPTLSRPLTSEDSVHAARLLLRHAYTRYETKDYRSADNLYAISRPLLPSLKDSVLHVRAYKWHATVLQWQEDYVGALNALDDAERVARQFGLTSQLQEIYTSKTNITSYIDEPLPMKTIPRSIPTLSILSLLAIVLYRLVVRSPPKPDPEAHSESV